MKNSFLGNIFKHQNKKTKLSNLSKIFKSDKKSRKRVLGFIFYGFLSLIFLSAISFAWFSKDLPTPAKIAGRKATESTKIYDRTGQILLYETGEQKRTVVGSDQISENLKNATVAIEDDRFYQHHGIDFRAIGSAIFEKITGRRQVTRGGSTITQQYIKNALLTSDRSIIRKAKEAILAVELESMFKKDEILTMYLNEIPYGGATAGAEAASRIYYGIPASQLSLSQAATLAAIPQAPTYYSPYGTHIKELVQRRDHILDRMTDLGKISREQAEEAKKEDTTTLGVAIKERNDSILAPHFAMYVLEEVAEKYGEEKIQKEGLNIITTLDFDKQQIATETIDSNNDKMQRYGASNAALVALDPNNGQILAMVGSRDYFNNEIDGNVNITTSARQPGSSFKPFAYATAFKESDYFPAKVLFDLRTDFGGGYIPNNYNGNFNGPVTMRQALSNSLNIPAVKTLSLAGIDNTIRTAEDMGITTLTDRDKYGLSLVLGAGEVKPIEMAGAFGVFATNGIKHDTKSILKITDGRGKVLEEYKVEDEKEKRVLDPQVAYLVTDILKDNNARSMVFGPHSSLYFPNREVAAKTGTTQDFKDAWTVGYTPQIAVAIWAGNSDGTKMKGGADGSVIAGPIFNSFINKALEKVDPVSFTRPEGIQEIEVEKYSGKLPTDQSVERIKDIFASWQVPTEKDDANKILILCKGTDLLAPNDLPDNLKEQKVFRNIHSERPGNSNWENPVIAWLESSGMKNSVPTETCDKDNFIPTISITSPKNNSEISGKTVFEATVQSSAGIKDTEFFIDDISIGKASSAGSNYSFEYDVTKLDSGTHKLKVTVIDQNDISAQSPEIDIVIIDSTSPTITGIISTILTASSVQIRWSTNEVATSEISYWQDGESKQKNQSDDQLVKTHTLLLKNLVSGATYHYKVNSRDKNNNLQISEEKSFTVSLKN